MDHLASRAVWPDRGFRDAASADPNHWFRGLAEAGSLRSLPKRRLPEEVMPIFLQILAAIIALPKIGNQVNAWMAQIFAWYVTQQNEENAHAICDAASFALRAKSQEERYEASEKWVQAFSRRAPK